MEEENTSGFCPTESFNPLEIQGASSQEVKLNPRHETGKQENGASFGRRRAEPIEVI